VVAVESVTFLLRNHVAEGEERRGEDQSSRKVFSASAEPLIGHFSF
jgi:hypothetical protein